MRVRGWSLTGLVVLLACGLLFSCVQGRISFSPDGRWFCFCGGLLEEGGELSHDRAGLFVVESATMEITRLVASRSLLSTPVFLADGKTVLYVEPRGGAEPELALRTVERDGGGGGLLLRILLKGPLSNRDLDGIAAWIRPDHTPDRQRLVLNVLTVNGPPVMLLLDLARGTVTALPAAGLLPGITPDGGRVVFLGTIEGDQTHERISELGTRPLAGVLDLTDLPDGTFQLNAPEFSGVGVFDVESGATSLRARHRLPLGLPCRGFSDDGRRLAVGMKRGVAVYDLETWQSRSYLEGEEVYHVQFDGAAEALLVLVSGKTDPGWAGAMLRVDLKTGEVERLLGGPGMPNLTALGRSPDGETVAVLVNHATVKAPLPFLLDRKGGGIRLGVPELDSALDHLDLWSQRLDVADAANLRLFDDLLARVEARTRQSDAKAPADCARRLKELRRTREDFR